MANNAQKQPPERVDDILIFAVAMTGLLFMILYWR
jgi:hypothetical protein